MTKVGKSFIVKYVILLRFVAFVLVFVFGLLRFKSFMGHLVVFYVLDMIMRVLRISDI